MMAGKKDAAAKPNAKATTAATNPGGWIPNQPATQTAPTADKRAAINSPFSEIFGLIIFLIKSCDTDAEITNNNPAAVESAAAKPPAATKAMTQLGNLAISGFANTIISLSTTNSFWSLLATY